MKKWQEERNYKKIRKPNGTVINIITVEGQDVEVTDEIFAVYSQMDRQERYKEEQQQNMVISLERLTGDNMKLEFLTSDYAPSAEDVVIAAEDAREQQALLLLLPKAILQLTDSKQELINALYFGNISVRKYAKQKGITDKAIRKKKKRSLVKLKYIFEKTCF